MCLVWLTVGSLVQEGGKWGRARQFPGRVCRARRASTSRCRQLSTTKPPENIGFTCQSTEVTVFDNSKKYEDESSGWLVYRCRGGLSLPTGPGTLQPGRTRPGAAAHPGCGGCPKTLCNMPGRWWAHRAITLEELTHKCSSGLIIRLWKRVVCTHMDPGSSWGWWWWGRWGTAEGFSTWLSTTATDGWIRRGAGSWWTER